MIATEKFAVRPTNKSRLHEVDFNAIDFGKIVSDHMLVAHYKNGQWQEPEIVPYGHISLSPTALALHYGQTVFEGMKAFRMKNGNVSIFRMEKHYDRFGKSLERLCMPQVPSDYFMEGIKQLVELDSAWVSGNDGASLYIRPFVFASNEERFGVHESEEYTFMVFTGPVSPYYSKPIRVKVEDKFMRAAHGGTGYAKCGGNYGSSFYPTKIARGQGFDQVLWTDGTAELNIEESGTMNVMFVIDRTVVTPALSDTILDGVTRDSFLAIAKSLGYPVEERKVSARELAVAADAGTLQEAFGVGTAAVAAPIKSIHILGQDYPVPYTSEQGFMYHAKHMLADIRMGWATDLFHWNTIIDSDNQG